MLPKLVEVVDFVPRKMRRNPWRTANQCIDDRAVLEFLEDTPRLRFAGESRESRASGPDAPARHGH